MNIIPPPTEEELETLTRLHVEIFVPREQQEELRLAALIRLRADRAKDGA